MDDGYDLNAHHRRFDLNHPMIKELGVEHNPTRYSLDFMAADKTGKYCQNDGVELTDYYIFGREVIAPADGIIADAIEGRPDNQIGEMLMDYEELMRTKNLKLLGGNWLIIDHENGEFSYFAHLRQGTQKVKIGDKVSKGQVIAEVGNSGDSFEPHLHYQLQTKPEMNCAGLPVIFHNFKRYYGTNVELVQSGEIDSGDMVEKIN